ncbi:serine/threonine/dual specificity protein kinase, catalytic domain-containing protein [Artemisia annua]|uniref:non-specific serine/threonine protein kinase n=1 Tax=Artemisia annua TaxID=35608 RepID=A0A2U1Q2Q3_ARTAN|nr:serine/threonine/dual specificity protein kinase, catalytic domain-containing protein [Artemisia annua]
MPIKKERFRNGYNTEMVVNQEEKRRQSQEKERKEKDMLGGFGKVYRGHIMREKRCSTLVAIKRLDSMSHQGLAEFHAKIEMLSKLRHTHLVLAYFYTGAGINHGVVHRDVKSSNILLDKDWAAKISDFGLAKISTIYQSSYYFHIGIKGTFGCMDPEIFMTGKFTRKTDIFAFGIVLFELLSGRHAVLPDGDEDLSLARWAQSYFY